MSVAVPGDFAEALALVTRFRFPFLVASVQFEWARCLLDRRPTDAAMAQAMLTEARSASSRHGFAVIERAIALVGTASE